MQESKRFYHPDPSVPFIVGRQVMSGETLEPTDVYSSSNGRWEPCPCPGLILGEGHSVIWVRPDPQ